jgi:hypothetical protein
MKNYRQLALAGKTNLHGDLSRGKAIFEQQLFGFVNASTHDIAIRRQPDTTLKCFCKVMGAEAHNSGEVIQSEIFLEMDLYVGHDLAQCLRCEATRCQWQERLISINAEEMHYHRRRDPFGKKTTGRAFLVDLRLAKLGELLKDRILDPEDWR